MNSSIIRYILGYVLKIEGFLMFLPCVVAVVYREQVGVYFLAVAMLCLLLGVVMTLRKPQNTVFYLKEGCVITSCATCHERLTRRDCRHISSLSSS